MPSAIFPQKIEPVEKETAFLDVEDAETEFLGAKSNAAKPTIQFAFLHKFQFFNLSEPFCLSLTLSTLKRFHHLNIH